MRGLSSRRATSVVIATMMMIAITVTGATLFYAYSQGLMGQLQGEVVKQPYLEQLALDYYDWTNLNTLKITIRNVGTAPVSFADFYLAGTRNTTSFVPPSCLVSGMLSVQSACAVPLAMTSFTVSGNAFSPTSGTAYIVKIVAIDGATFSFSCIAGSNTH